MADTPPESAVDALAKTFQDSDGDLGAVCRAVIRLDVAWDSTGSKIKTPHELVIATLRVLQLDELPVKTLAASFAELGQVPFMAPSPAGWPDRNDEWISPEGMLRRLSWLHSLSSRVAQDYLPMDVANVAFGENVARAIREAVEQAPSAGDALALVFASPEFQRR